MWLKEQNIQNHYKMLKDYRTNNLLSGQIKQPSDGITTSHKWLLFINNIC